VVCFAVACHGASSIQYLEDSSVAGGCTGVLANVTPGVQGTSGNTGCAVVTGTSNPETFVSTIPNFTTTGDTMNGMTVTVTFSDGKTATGTWVGNTVSTSNTTGVGGTSGVNGTDSFSISQTGNTYTFYPVGGGNVINAGGAFRLTNNSTSGAAITQIVLDGHNGTTSNCPAGTPAGLRCLTMFDRIAPGTDNGTSGTGAGTNEQSPGSNVGMDFQIDNGSGQSTLTGNFAINVTYSQEVGFFTPATTCQVAATDTGEHTGAAPCGDEYSKLTIAFNTTSGVGIAANSTFLFDQDTDTGVTPEPSNLILMSFTGLLVGAGLTIRRQRLKRVFATRNA
jgi:hypothetical protein